MQEKAAPPTLSLGWGALKGSRRDVGDGVDHGGEGEARKLGRV